MVFKVGVPSWFSLGTTLVLRLGPGINISLFRGLHKGLHSLASTAKCFKGPHWMSHTLLVLLEEWRNESRYIRSGPCRDCSLTFLDAVKRHIIPGTI